MRPIALFLLSALSFLPAPAHAEWLQASSAHFVIYADDSERNLRRFSQQLERYHAAMALLTGQKSPPPSPSNRVTIYVVHSQEAVSNLARAGRNYTAGFYVPRAGRSLAVVPRVTSGTPWLSFSMMVLLHEYAHHFAISTSSIPLPPWFSEGGAEFFASSSFDSEGSVWVGRPAHNRIQEQYYARDTTVADVLVPPEDPERRKRGILGFYGKSWALYHYLVLKRHEQANSPTT